MSCERFYVVIVPTPNLFGATSRCYGPFYSREVAQAVAQGTPRTGNDVAPAVYEVERP